MENIKQGFWEDFAKQVKEMTNSSKRKCIMTGLWSLNKALLDLYQVKNNACNQKVFNRYAGYALHSVVLLDSMTLVFGDTNIDYSMDDPDVFDPVDKSALLNIAITLSGLAKEYSLDKRVHNRGDPDRDEWEDYEWTTLWTTSQMLDVTLNRILRYIRTNTDLTLREMATQHVDIFYGREPAPVRGYDLTD